MTSSGGLANACRRSFGKYSDCLTRTRMWVCPKSARARRTFRASSSAILVMSSPRYSGHNLRVMLAWQRRVPTGSEPRLSAAILRGAHASVTGTSVGESASGELRRLLARPWSFQAPRRVMARRFGLVEMVRGGPARSGREWWFRGEVAGRPERSNLPGRCNAGYPENWPVKNLPGRCPSHRLCGVLSIMRAAWQGAEKRFTA